MALVELSDVYKRDVDGDREVAVLDGVSLAVHEGDFVGVRGARRSGKSTLLAIAAGLLPADAGRVRICGCDLDALGVDERVAFARGRVGLATADWRPHRRMTVVEHTAMPLLSAPGVSLRMARSKARAALERVGALRLAEESTPALSLGESVRVELARALVAEPRVLLVDEPPVLRSPSEGRALYGLLRALGEEEALAVIVASEDLELVQKARRVFAVGGGELREMGRAGEVVRLPTRRAGG